MPSLRNGERFVIGLSGWAWVDNSYPEVRAVDHGPEIHAGQHQVLEGAVPHGAPRDADVRDRQRAFHARPGRAVGTGDPTIGRQTVGGADTDDLWLRIGKWNRWDVQFGRFEGWEVFHLGMGLDFNSFERAGAVASGNPSISFYGVTDNQFRPGGSVGKMPRGTTIPSRSCASRLLGMAGPLPAAPAYAARPVANLDSGWVKLKVGTEYQKILSLNTSVDNSASTSKGVGGALQFVLAPHVEFGLNAAQGTVLSVSRTGVLEPEGSFTRTSLGAFANISNGDRGTRSSSASGR